MPTMRIELIDAFRFRRGVPLDCSIQADTYLLRSVLHTGCSTHTVRGETQCD